MSATLPAQSLAAPSTGTPSLHLGPACSFLNTHHHGCAAMSITPGLAGDVGGTKNSRAQAQTQMWGSGAQLGTSPQRCCQGPVGQNTAQGSAWEGAEWQCLPMCRGP